MQKDNKILVLGASGLVGSALLKKIMGKGYTNVIGTCHSKKKSSYPISLIQIDLTNQSAVNSFFDKEKPEYVFLAAGKVGGIHANNTYKADFIYENIMIASNVIHAAYEFGVKKLLNLGSSCIYPKFAPQPLKEEYLLTSELEPTNEPYAIAKISAIKLCRYFNEQYGTNFISVMPTNLYGPNDNFDLLNSHVLPALLRKFHLAKLLSEEKYNDIIIDLEKYGNYNEIYSDDFNKIKENLEKFGIYSDRVKLWGSGSPFREFLHVHDMADACIFLMENMDYADIGEFVNIGIGKDHTIKDIAELVRKSVGFRGSIDWDSSKPDGTPKKLLDVSRLNSLGWKARIELNEGIKLFYDWYKKADVVNKLF